MPLLFVINIADFDNTEGIFLQRGSDIKRRRWFSLREATGVLS